MKRVRELFVRLANLILRRNYDERIRAEREEHIYLRTEENMRLGMSPIEARPAGTRQVWRARSDEGSISR